MDVPTYWDGGSQESVCDPSRQTWASYYSLRARARDRARRIHVGPQFTCMELAKVPIPNQNGKTSSSAMQRGAASRVATPELMRSRISWGLKR